MGPEQVSPHYESFMKSRRFLIGKNKKFKKRTLNILVWLYAIRKIKFKFVLRTACNVSNIFLVDFTDRND